ncbi:MAG: hypothetical protein AB7O97_02660 [Planctomycetota bacterium]
MSDEGKSLIESVFIEKIGARYPFIRASGVNQQYGIRFFPSIYCIAPDGTILTTPKDRMPSEQFIEEQLQHVTLAPKMPADSRFDNLRKWWEEREHARIAEYLEKMLQAPDLDAEVREVYAAQQQTLQQRMTRQAERVVELAKGPDFARSKDRLEKIVADWKGLPPAVAAEAELERFGKDARIKEELTAAKTLDRLLERNDAAKTSGRRKLMEALEKFAKKYPGTYAAVRAQTIRGELVEQGE